MIALAMVSPMPLPAVLAVRAPRQSISHSGVKDTSLASNPEAEWLDTTRTIPRSLAPLLEQLELDQADLVTTARLDELVRAASVRTTTRTVATRLRERGWLLPTGQRGVSVFAPKLKYLAAKGVPVLHPTSVVVHMAAAPGRVRSWSSALEWFPDVAAEVALDDVLTELDGRPRNSLRTSGLSTPRAAPGHRRSAHRSLDQNVVRPAGQGGPTRQSLADRGHLASLRPAHAGGARMATGPITLTVGWIGRHTPPGAGVDGRDAAVSDIDGTTIGPFTYGVSERRGKWSLTIQSPFGTDESTLSSKFDIRHRRGSNLFAAAGFGCRSTPPRVDPDHWLRTRTTAEVDLADIGALAVPTPSLAISTQPSRPTTASFAT